MTLLLLLLGLSLSFLLGASIALLIGYFQLSHADDEEEVPLSPAECRWKETKTDLRVRKREKGDDRLGLGSLAVLSALRR